MPHLRVGGPVELINLTADGRREFSLPSVEVPVVFFRRRAERMETKGTLDTVLFEPEAERFSLVWRSSLRLQRDIFEIPRAVVGCMSRAWWRSVTLGSNAKQHGEISPRHDLVLENA
jgi:hypothetical protein